jgi:hypothetical protein
LHDYWCSRRAEASFFVAQIELEIWGIGSQYLLCEPQDQFLEHLGKLKKLIDEVLSGGPSCSELKGHLADLAAQIQIWANEFAKGSSEHWQRGSNC